MMIAKVIVDIPSKSVDFKFDYIVPTHLESVVQVGVRNCSIWASYYSRLRDGYSR